ncbi:unnamed protein product [Adineta ricciae]|uniref:ADP ribosyltransferase domain-containing protein n=1 Tax=Adineta ricciae TaxID=249248 RepID=A0A815DXW0_ADIRI|nr:unnamed protein product [Adineta ricciae]
MFEQTPPATVQQANEFNRIKIEETQDISVIWLDTHIHSSNPDYQNAITHLQHIVNDIYTFTDNDECIDFILTLTDTDVCLITSGSVGQRLVPCVHDISNIDSIFIFCDDQNRHEQWTKNWCKVKSVSIDIIHICEQLTKIIRRYELTAIPMSFVQSDKRLDRLEPSFMYTKIIKEILLTIQFKDKHIKQFVKYCCDNFVDTEVDRKKVKQLEDEYYQHTPIWWYTTQRFIYSMLNRALRVMDGEVITLMGFFISDLHRHIEELHKQQFGDASPTAKSFPVYRGQGLMEKDFDQLMATKGGLMSFNNFLSTSENRDVSLIFTPGNRKNRDVISVLFVITIDPKQSTTSFASVRHISQFPAEEEVLFSMHSIFRIRDVKPMDGNEKVYEVALSLTSDNDKELMVLTEQIRKESFPNTEGWSRLSLVLADIGQSDIAERICRVLIDEAPSEDSESHVYNGLGNIKCQKGQYEEAITLFRKSLELLLMSSSPNHPDVASFHNNIGTAYSDMGDYPKALSSYEQALKIQLQSLPPNHPHLASSYNNIGNAYSHMGDYPMALLSYEQALKIKLQSLPPNHPDVASSYNNIGNAYSDMGDYPKALSSYEQALKIKLQSLPPNHPHVASSYNNIGGAYRNMGNYSKALSSYEQALKIRELSLPPNHPDVASSYNNIGNAYSDMGDYSKALSSYEQALKIQLQSLPPNHPSVAKSYSNIGIAYYNMGDYPKALSSYEQALKIKLQSLPPNHPSVAKSYSNIGIAYYNMGDYPKAFSSYEQALKIQLQSLPPNHPDVASSYNNIGNAYSDMGDYPKALSSHEQALKIREQSLPPNHPSVASSYNNIGNAYSHMGDQRTAVLFYTNAVQIAQEVLPSTHPHLQLIKRNLERAK